MNEELRVLSGLHRGARLPLDELVLLFGANEDADVVLVDPGIAAHHATLQCAHECWTLTADGGPVYGADRCEPQTLRDLEKGSAFRLGETWLVISDASADWQPIPPMPLAADAMTDDLEFDRDQHDKAGAAEFEENAGAESVPVAIRVPEAPSNVGSPNVIRRYLRNWMFAPAGLVTLLTAFAAYAYSAKPSQPHLVNPALPLAELVTPHDRNDRHTPAALANEVNVPNPHVQPLTPAAMRTAFRKRLKDADLLQHFDLDLNDGNWAMRAHLDDVEIARFERVLKTFMSEHKIRFPISAKVGSAEAMLPFKIQQVVTGSNAGIVTGTGERFYVGDEVAGVRLVAINENHLTFMGKRKIEVVW